MPKPVPNAVLSELNDESLTRYRDRWIFTFTARDLIPYAEAKIAYHRSAFEFWRERHEKAKAEKSVVEEREEAKIDDRAEVFAVTPGIQLNSAMTSYAGGQENTLVSAKQSMQWHVGQAEEYRRAIAAFTHQPDLLLPLTVADLAYFGINDTPTASPTAEGGGQ